MVNCNCLKVYINGDNFEAHTYLKYWLYVLTNTLQHVFTKKQRHMYTTYTLF